jgi:hypothetical protein
MNVPDRSDPADPPPGRPQPDRPWWASSDPAVDRLDPDEDALDAILSARERVEHPGRDAGTEGAARVPGGGVTDDRPAPGDADDPRTPHGATDEGGDTTEGVCGICPVCTGWRYLREHHPDVATHLAAAGRHLSEAHPEVVDHLAAAGRHLATALRQVLDDRAGTEASGPTSPDPPSRRTAGGRSRRRERDVFERIDVDDGQGQV